MCQSAPFLLLLLGAIASPAEGQLFSVQFFSSTDRGTFFGRFFVGSAGAPDEGGQPHPDRDIVTADEHPSIFRHARAWVPSLRGMLGAPVSGVGGPGMPRDRDWEEAPVLASAPQSAVSVGTQQLVRSAKFPPSFEEQARLVAPFVALLLLAGVSGVAAFLAFVKCNSRSMGEDGLTPLSEALAPVSREIAGTWQQWVEEARPGQPRSSVLLEATPIKGLVAASKDLDKLAVTGYVSGIYDRACGQIEERASRAYLARVYARAAA